jgi:hypothetical protein
MRIAPEKAPNLFMRSAAFKSSSQMHSIAEFFFFWRTPVPGSLPVVAYG